MAIDESFDKQFFNKFLWKKLKIVRASKNITFENLAKQVWVSYSYIVNMFNWRQIATLEKWKVIAEWLWVYEKEFDQIVREAKKAEYEQTTGTNIEIIPNWKINTLENIDFDNDELLKVMFKKDYWKELSDHDRDEILNFIKFKANK